MPVVRISDELFKEIQKYAEPIVDNFETAMWKALKANAAIPTDSPKPSRVKTGGVTRQRDFRKPILETLVELGGQAYVQEVIDGVKKRMMNRLTSPDMEQNKDGSLKWIKAVHFQRLAMVQLGMIADNSPLGLWRITDRGREWLREQ